MGSERIDSSYGRTVVFLGAGASAAEGAPVQSNLFRDFFISARTLETYDHTQKLVQELRTFFWLMFGIDVDQDDLSKANFPTFEEALGVLDLAEIRRESFRDFSLENTASNSGRIRFVRQYLTSALVKVIANKLVNPPFIHRKLVNNLAKNDLLASTTFVSTNYDILIDNALATCKDGMFGENVDYAIEFVNYKQGVWSKPKQNATQLLKLHGSLNWLYCPACNELEITPFEKGVIQLIDSPANTLCEQCQSLKTPTIIPPTFYKDMSNVFVSTVWNHAEAALRKADHIIFCGYSFPDADMHIKYLLKRAETNHRSTFPLQFTVINHHLCKDKNQAKEEKRYRRFLSSRVEYRESSFENFADDPERFYRSKFAST